MAAVRVVAWSASVGALGAAVQLLWRRWKRFRSRKQYDGLDGVVSFSSRLIAAARAIESMRADALFIDPFARLLAGPKAMARHQGFDEADKSVNINKPSPAAGSGGADQPHNIQDGNQQQQDIISQQQQRQEQVPMYEGREVSRLVIRTVFFDEATLMATGQPAPRSGKALAAVAAHIQQHQLKPCRQLVMLGAGMDTRPWRLPLDPHLKWFELDRADVLAAKQKALKEAGAGFEPGTSVSAANANKQQESGSNGSSVQYSLRVGQWACASADLQKPGWVDKLQEAGLQPDTPTVWAAEGLLYYLEPSSVAPMLKEAASMSPPGSMIITNFMTAEGLNLLRTSPLRSDLDPPPKNAKTAATDGTASDGTASSDTATNGSGPADAQPASNGNTGTSSSNGLLAKNAAPTNAQAGTKDVDPAAGSHNGNNNAQHSNSSSSSSTTSPSDPALSNGGTDKDNQQGAGSAGSNGNGSTGSDNAAGAAGVQKPGGGIRKTGLLSQFKWGCPDNVEEFFAECGWQLLVRYSLTQATHAYGWNVLHTPQSRVRTDSQEVQYVVGVVMK